MQVFHVREPVKITLQKDISNAEFFHTAGYTICGHGKGNSTMKKIFAITCFSLLLCLAFGVSDHSLRAARVHGSLEKFNTTLVKITKKAIPVVVNITVEKKIDRKKIIRFMEPDMPFKFKQPSKPVSKGSGVIFNNKGYVITNNHVIEDSTDIKVTLSDRREFPCELIGSDPATDLAVIKMKTVPKELPALTIADSDKISVGEIAVAIGNPFGFSHTVTMGIISATGRQDVGLADYENFIQTDAAINPGNSGGALVNIKGELIGINTAIISRYGGNTGIGFAIPSNMMKQVVGELIKNGKVIRGWLGVYIQPVTPDIAESFNYKSLAGALVSDVMKKSPAQNSKIRAGDIITKIDGTDIRDVNHLRRIIAWKQPGTSAKVSVFRSGKILDVDMSIGTLPDKKLIAKKERLGPQDDLGIVISDIDEELAYRYRIPDRRGVVIVGVTPDSPADSGGLKSGDTIREINQRPVQDTDAFRSIMMELKSNRRLLFLVRRLGINKFIVITKPE